MESRQFLHACKLISTKLIHQSVDRTFNSVGSSIFFEFGAQKEFVFPNGKKGIQREWSLWLNWTSWRISQHDEYIVGSGEDLDVNIQAYLDKLLKKKFQSFRFTSQFLDVEFNFEEGYRVSTFFNRIIEDQWIMFFPDQTEFIIDCSSKEKIKSIQDIASQIKIQKKYKKLKFPETKVMQILFEKNEISAIICTEGFLIHLGLSAWRFEENNQYQIGRMDYYFSCLKEQDKELKDKLLGLVGKKIKSISTDSSGMDAEIEFEGGYMLKIFTHARRARWKISQNSKTVLEAYTDNVIKKSRT